MRLTHSLSLLLLAIATLASAPCSKADEPAPTELSLGKRAIETPLLKYRLFPSEADLQPGDAAPILLRLPWDQRPWMEQVFPTLDAWEKRPLNAPEWAKSEGVLPDRFYGEMRRAAFRHEASWEYPLRETSPYMVVLSDVQDLRSWLGRGLSARIRSHLSRGELDLAREGILVGLANSRHIARTPLYINQSVATSIQHILLRRVEELIAQPHSPNLYWALTSLPDSLVELDRAADFESRMFSLTFPAVRDFDRPRDPAEWTRMAAQMVQFLEELDELPRQKDIPLAASTKRYVAQVAPQARIDLAATATASGIASHKTDQMSDDEAVVRWYASLRIAQDEHLAAIMRLTPTAAAPQWNRLQDESRTLQQKTGSNASFQTATAVYGSAWRLKRKIQMLRIIEAVRHHAALHDGQLPATLDEIQEVPLPLDPMTNLPFVWNVEGQSATLASPSASTENATSPNSEIHTPQKYVLKLNP